MNPLNTAYKIIDWFCPLSEPEQKLDIDHKIEIVETELPKPTEQEWGNAHFGD